MNLDDPHQRRTFIKKLVLSCEQAGQTDGTEPLTIIANRVTPALLIQLGEECGRRREKGPPDPKAEQAQRTADEQSARMLLDDHDVLFRVGEAMRANGYAGKLEPAQLVYVAFTSRLLEHPISLALVGDPAAGKNATLDAALALVPLKAVYEFTASSPTALVYTDEDFQHRIVIFKEADSIPDRGPAASAIRALADGSTLRYEVTIRGARTGGFETVRIQKAGPTGLITTSTCPLPPQLHTRLLPVPMFNSDERLTTYQVICAKADRAAGRLPPLDREPFLALQRWLSRGSVEERRVTVPFGWALARAMSGCSLELRTRRDFEGLLSCVKTIAFLRQRHRKRAPGGAIEAIIDDYRVARQLLEGSFSEAAAQGVTTVVRETVAMIGEREKITRTELAERLGGMPKQTVSWRVRRALSCDLLDEQKEAGRRLLRRKDPLPKRLPPLPDVEEVEGYFFGVPAPRRSEWFDRFIHDFHEAGPSGVTAAEWAAWVGQPLEVVRGRLDVLVRVQALNYDEKTQRYAVRVASEDVSEELIRRLHGAV
jgi:DNA-binding transcriptional ArsR family regulator